MPHRLLGGAAFLRGKLLQSPAATAPSERGPLAERETFLFRQSLPH